MSEGSPIEWLQRPGTKSATYNPIIAWRTITLPDGSTKRLRGWHCEHVHGGCVHCYSEKQNIAGARGGTKLPYKPGHRAEIEIELHEPTLLQPLKWRQPRTIFVCSMTDLYGDWVKDEWLDKIKAVQALTPQHTYIELTKRPERMRAYATWLRDGQWWSLNDLIWNTWLSLGKNRKPHHPLSGHQPAFPLSNVWGLVSCSTQEDWDTFYPILKDTPLAIRGVSYEPALGPLDIWLARCGAGAPHLDWLICGGESGPNARPMNPQWARDIQGQCHAAGIAFFHKQNGEYVSVSEVEGPGDHFHFPDGRTVRRVGKKAAGRSLDGRTHSEFPEART